MRAHQIMTTIAVRTGEQMTTSLLAMIPSPHLSTNATTCRRGQARCTGMPTVATLQKSPWRPVIFIAKRWRPNVAVDQMRHQSLASFDRKLPLVRGSQLRELPDL